ncbi:sensor domain-containing diguanylate cyclase [Mycobacterium sp. 236(2023)]|uniref:GGDEF domain-containing protein n=1 Tax=Mycobacterium sp. 236(2023) TaxID=3038163 RepID=UPI002414F853|nr:sensor domain-containing diguanylate cyclase [Mycobacterium sp. 236(2023)]MDG4664250.1 diguanylate cyclase [Mycobacterium sp. 236(2023)]
MGAGLDWLDFFRAAAAPAFLCRHHDGTLELTAHTEQFAIDITDEHRSAALAELATRLAGGPTDDLVEIHAPSWTCVAQRMDADDEYLGLMRTPTDRQLRDDLFHDIVENLPDVVSRHDRNIRHLYVNSAIDRITTPVTAADFVGKDHREVGMPEHLVTLWQKVMGRVFEAGEPVAHEFVFPAPEGPRYFLFRAVPEFAGDGSVKAVLNAARDLTELKAVQHELEILAQTDALTSLLNRRSLLERIDSELTRVGRGDGTLDLLLLDVDDFKSVNDRFGHPAGDRVLTSIANVLREQIQVSDFAARLGGDEFCVGLVDTAVAEVGAITDRIYRSIRQVADSRGRSFDISVSIGRARARKSDADAVSLIARVDALMYRQKAILRQRRRPD